MKEKGITMLALVITTLVLLILASISLIGLTGEEGLLKKTNNASEKALIAKYQEELEIIDKRMELKKIKKQVSSEKYMERYKEEIEKNEVFEEANVTLENINTIKLITKEGYIFIITRNEIKYIGKDNNIENEEAPPDLHDTDIELLISPSELTNTDVTVTVKLKNEEYNKYMIQYSKDEINWEEYVKPVRMTKNGSISVRLWNGIKVGGYTTGNVLNIDKLIPNQFTPTVTNTANSITISGSTTDQEMTSEYASSGIDKYYFSIDDGATWLPENGQAETSYTFENLEIKKYKLKMKAVDRAGNYIITEGIEKSLKLPTIEEISPNTYVNYIDKNGDTIKCIVLYEASSSHGLQIISAEPLGSVHFGYASATNSVEKMTKAQDDYNKAKTTLNTAARAYLNDNGYAVDARCVGSDPDNPDKDSAASKYIEHKTSYTSTNFSGFFKREDEDYLEDVNRMIELGILYDGKNDYWLASRNYNTNAAGDEHYFAVRKATNYDRKSLSSGPIAYFYTGKNYHINGPTAPFRVVFKMSDNIKIISGSGTEQDPYNLGI